MTTFRLRWDAECADCKRTIPAGMWAQYCTETGLTMRHVNGCPSGRHSTGTHVRNLGAVVDRRGDYPGRRRHRAICQHAYVPHPRGDDYGCDKVEDEGRCGFYRQYHPTMLPLKEKPNEPQRD